ncbi:hypothetical protein KNU14_gp48 [Gordonia phage Buggaboo]|uniref:Uncharacterized protein n=1 Tax=Gordonia phage Buggaboo TaxID=2315529 RepID=A0A386KCY4_9CAUD|nr:hypothetical protein KNU14_gp48 [Gordonia phage Buggaboo]AVE00705.1 hypothetical protein SEA_SUPERSULLEY_48 [Gordonia phage SuperSulley]AYD83240.1 hypothetical protein SEA_BUGGABOO_48 [Gordonia phage Buggaboo]
MASTNADRIAIVEFMAARGTKITPHNGDPGTTGASRIGTLEGNTAWGSGSVAGTVATVVGSAVPFNIPANTTVSHYGMWNGTTFLRGYPMDNPITVGAAATSVDITPTVKYNAA